MSETATYAWTLKSAAIMYEGQLYTGSNHILILDEIKKEDANASVQNCVEGFTTTDGRFLARNEAKPVAHEQALLRPGRDKFVDPELWTEYLIQGTLS